LQTNADFIDIYILVVKGLSYYDMPLLVVVYRRYYYIVVVESRGEGGARIGDDGYHSLPG
jgi:hypothetical protein